MKKTEELIFTFKTCRYWLRFPKLTGKEQEAAIKRLQADRACGAELIEKPMFNNGVQAETAIVDVFELPGSGYEYKLGTITISEDSIFFKRKQRIKTP